LKSGSAAAAIHEQQFPLPYYRRIYQDGRHSSVSSGVMLKTIIFEWHNWAVGPTENFNNSHRVFSICGILLNRISFVELKQQWPIPGVYKCFGNLRRHSKFLMPEQWHEARSMSKLHKH
jgi:hypothetical protein